MTILLFITGFFLFIWGALLFANWVTHISMVKGECSRYGWGNYRKFKEQFNKVEWERDSHHPYSFFGKNGRHDHIHADIIRFNGDGMILPFISYIRYSAFIAMNKYKVTRETVKW